MTQNYYGAWAREVLVYPKKDGEFKKGRDVVDAFKDDKGREWIFPAHSIPEVAIGRKGIGLFVDPQEIEVKDKKAVVLARPESIVVLENFIQNNGEIGKVNEATRIPLSVEKSESQDLTDDQRRWLWRVNGAGVRPLVRGYVFEDALDDIRIVHADGYHAGEFGVGWASTNLEQDKPSQAVAQAPNWLSALRGEAEAAEPVLSALHNIISQDDLQKLERLVRRAKEQA
jgi:hypothetical protein